MLHGGTGWVLGGGKRLEIGAVRQLRFGFYAGTSSRLDVPSEKHRTGLVMSPVNTAWLPHFVGTAECTGCG